MLLPYLPGKELPQLVTPFLVVILNPVFLVTVLYKYSVIFKQCNAVFLVRVLAMPHLLCTCTLRVLYVCGWEFVPSVYFFPITWNGISPPSSFPPVWKDSDLRSYAHRVCCGQTLALLRKARKKSWLSLFDRLLSTQTWPHTQAPPYTDLALYPGSSPERGYTDL